MTKEEEDLLLKDLCARLPYGVRIMFTSNGFRWDYEQTLKEIRQCDDGEWAINGWGIHGIKPYLRPMSSMTDEEEEEYNNLNGYEKGVFPCTEEAFDWLNAHHFDYRRLIYKRLAIVAPDGMYKL